MSHKIFSSFCSTGLSRTRLRDNFRHLARQLVRPDDRPPHLRLDVLLRPFVRTRRQGRDQDRPRVAPPARRRLQRVRLRSRRRANESSETLF